MDRSLWQAQKLERRCTLVFAPDPSNLTPVALGIKLVSSWTTLTFAVLNIRWNCVMLINHGISLETLFLLLWHFVSSSGTQVINKEIVHKPPMGVCRDNCPLSSVSFIFFFLKKNLAPEVMFSFWLERILGKLHNYNYKSMLHIGGCEEVDVMQQPKWLAC